MCENIDEELYLAASDGIYDKVAECISRGANTTWTEGHGMSALHRAARDGRVRLASLGPWMGPGGKDY